MLKIFCSTALNFDLKKICIRFSIGHTGMVCDSTKLRLTEKAHPNFNGSYRHGMW